MKTGPALGDSPARILIVDDEPHSRHLLEVMLAPEGYTLAMAGSAKEAFALVAEQPPDLILLDIMMPGTDGYEVMAEIKHSPATTHVPVVIITALDDRNARMLGLSAGAADFLAKPVDQVELCVRVRNLLRLKAYGAYYDKHSQALEVEVSSRTADLVERTKDLERQAAVLTERAAVLTEQAALLDLAHDAIVVHDMKSRILFWSRGAEVMYGWARPEAVGQTMWDLLKARFPQSPATIEALLLGQGQWEGEVTHHTRDGTRLVVASRWTLQRDADGKPVRILTIHNNITDRKHAEAERRVLTERLSLATAVAKVGVWEWELAHDTLTWDATMFDIYGLPPAVSMPYAQWSAVIHPDDLTGVEGTLQRAIAERGEGSTEFRIIRPDGSVRHLSSAERAVLDERGKVSRIIGVNMDISERKEAEAALEQSRKDQIRFKDEFLSHVSHELRSPLTAVKQFTTILLGGLAGDLNLEQREYQQIVLRNIRQLQSMIDDLLEVTRLETGKLTVEPESVSILDAVNDTVNTLAVTARAKGLSLTSDLPPDLPSAQADQTRLRQILIILVDNAIKFTPEGGAITIQARMFPADHRFLLLEVSDTGCGISPEMSERIFERLYQVSDPNHNDRKGLGLGLYICKELVVRQGGQIWVARRPQEGSTFSFTLPVSSLNNVIAPLLRHDKWPGDSIGLVMVEASLPDGWPSKASREEWSHDARNLVQRCLLPDLDVILPTIGSDTPQRERFFVAAFTDRKGASSLANRIRKQFERIPRLKRTGMTLSVSFSMLDSCVPDVGASAEYLVNRMAVNLEESIKSQSSLRPAINE